MSDNAKAQPKAKSKRQQIEQKLSDKVLDIVGSENFGRSASAVNKIRAKIDKLVADKMSDQLASLNIPSREDIHDLGERLLGIESQINRIEEMLLEVRAEKRSSGVTGKVPRTRVAPSKKKAASRKPTSSSKRKASES